MNDETCELIGIISAASDKYGDKLLEYMDEYGITALCCATEQTLREYAVKHGLLAAVEVNE